MAHWTINAPVQLRKKSLIKSFESKAGRIRLNMTSKNWLIQEFVPDWNKKCGLTMTESSKTFTNKISHVYPTPFNNYQVCFSILAAISDKLNLRLI